MFPAILFRLCTSGSLAHMWPEKRMIRVHLCVVVSWSDCRFRYASVVAAAPLLYMTLRLSFPRIIYIKRR